MSSLGIPDLFLSSLSLSSLDKLFIFCKRCFRIISLFSMSISSTGSCLLGLGIKSSTASLNKFTYVFVLLKIESNKIKSSCLFWELKYDSKSSDKISKMVSSRFAIFCIWIMYRLLPYFLSTSSVFALNSFRKDSNLRFSTSYLGSNTVYDSPFAFVTVLIPLILSIIFLNYLYIKFKYLIVSPTE